MTESEPPRAFSGTPDPPSGTHDLQIVGSPIKVFTDANTFYQSAYRTPLLASALEGDLIVYWSVQVQEEVARVAERVALAAAQRQSLHLAPEERFAFIQAASDRMRGEADSLISAVGPILRLATVESASIALDVSGVADPDDRPHILAAHAAGVGYLLTLDQRHLPHGTIVGGV